MQNYHEDERRTLTSIPYKDGELKVIITKEDCVLGNHYHKIKREEFTLIEGESIITIDGTGTKMPCGEIFTIQPNQIHSFLISKDSILMCICSHTYNDKDDYR